MKTIITFLATILLLSTGFSFNNEGSLIISLSNIIKTGKIKIGVYRACEDFPNDKFLIVSKAETCKTGACTFLFNNLPYGQYAVAIYQDVNANDDLDTGLFGIPSEPFAFSNNFRPKFDGPTYDKCKFEFSHDKQMLDITMINSLFGDN